MWLSGLCVKAGEVLDSAKCLLHTKFLSYTPRPFSIAGDACAEQRPPRPEGAEDVLVAIR